MRFKQNSKLVNGTALLYVLVLFVVLFVAMKAFDKNQPFSAALILGIGFGFPLLSMICLKRLPESRRTVTLGEQEASIKTDNPAPITIRIPWESAEHVIFSRKRGENAIVIVDGKGTVIWFYSSFKAMKYVKSLCTEKGIEIETLPENEVRSYYVNFDAQLATL